MRFSTRKFYSLLVTSSVAMAITFILLLSDTIIAGRLLGENAIAAVNLVVPVFSMVAFVSLLISVGTSVNYSGAMGEFKKDRADQIFGQGVILALASGAVLFLLTFWGKTLYFRALSPVAEMLDAALDYYSAYPYIVLSYPVFSLLADMVYTDGDEKICNLAYIVQILGNLVSSIILGRVMGISGISLGTLIGLIAAILMLLLHFFRKGNSLHFRWHIRLRDVLHVAKYGIADGERFLCSSILLYLINQLIIRYFGSAMLLVASVVTGVIELTIVFDGIGQAMAPLICVYQGEGNYHGIRTMMRTTQ